MYLIHNRSIFYVSNQRVRNDATVGHPVDYRSHVNTVIRLLEDNRPLDEPTQVGAREISLA